jgi:predicted outer membrane repeat protein
MPISPLSFKLLNESKAAGKLPSTLPTDYPNTDFYGDSISGGGAAGAVQASVANLRWYYLELSTNDSARGSVEPLLRDEDGLVSGGNIDIKANPIGAYEFGHWLVNGTRTGAAPQSISGHTWIKAVFVQRVTVTVSDEATLCNALANAEDDDIITLDGVTPGTTTIELTSALEITKSLTIEGNGITLTRASSWAGFDPLLRITATAEALVRRVRFKDGLSIGDGGAIYSDGILTLESCIFSGNQSDYGGAVYSSNTLTIRGCTFYDNTANQGGAVYFNSWDKTLTLTGTLFFKNTAPEDPAVAFDESVTTTFCNNVSDVAFGQENETTTGLPVSPKSFKLLYQSGAANKLPADLPADYPVTDFYGNSISGKGAAGAVQASVTNNQSGYYYLGLSVNNSQRGIVTATPPPDDEDGLVLGGEITITKNHTGFEFGHWLVDGVKSDTAPTTISDHTWVKAIFVRRVSVNVSTGEENLRDTLADAEDDDIITLDGVTPGTTTIELTSALEITKSLTIEGNGITLTRADSWSDEGYDPLLRITGSTAETLARRVHFKDGLSMGDGGAIYSGGILTLESCIFSGNQVEGWGGAIASFDTLTIRGCTFYGNSAAASGGYTYGGGAIFFSASGKTLTLTGNLFYGNTDGANHPVVSVEAGFVNASYNVVDVALGTGDTESGWSGGTGNIYIVGNPIDPFTFAPNIGTPIGTPDRDDIDIVPSGLSDFPATDFNGDTRTFSPNGVAGAVN